MNVYVGKKRVIAFDAQMDHLVGTMLIIAGAMSYCGGLNGSYRQTLVQQWQTACETHKNSLFTHSRKRLLTPL